MKNVLLSGLAVSSKILIAVIAAAGLEIVFVLVGGIDYASNWAYLTALFIGVMAYFFIFFTAKREYGLSFKSYLSEIRVLVLFGLFVTIANIWFGADVFTPSYWMIIGDIILMELVIYALDLMDR